MTERDSLYDILNTYLQSDSDKKDIKKKIKKRDLIERIIKIKNQFDEQQSLFKVVEHQLQELLKTVSGLKEKEPTKEQEKQETNINEKILRKSLDVLEKNNRISREILAIGEHYKVDIYKLNWKKSYLRYFYVQLSKKMKKSGFSDYKLNWDRINKLIKHTGKPIEEYKDNNISPKKLIKIKALVAQTLEQENND
jgi:hypothetical protein